MLRRDGKQPGIHEVSPLRKKGLWRKGFANKVGFELAVKE